MGDRKSGKYQFMLVLLLSLNFGVVFFDRNTANFLMPFIQPDLKMTDTQVGWLSSGLSLTWALSGFGVGWLSEKIGRRKPVIVIATILFCACSAVAGIASTFLGLLAARILMGAMEGGIMPVSHSIIVAEVDEDKRGLAMGVGQNLGSNLLGSSAAPLIMVPIALAWGWQAGFYVAAIPGLITAALIWFLIDEPSASKFARPDGAKAGLATAFADRNVLICMIVSVLLVSYLVCCWAFMPLWLTQNRGFDPNTVKWLMTTLGISAGLGSFLVSGWSDYIGRKPVIVGFSFLGVILPLAALFYTGSPWVMALIFFFGWGLNSVFPIFMATVPSESVDPRLTASLSGLVVAAGEVIGGVLSPLLGGVMSDAYGRESVLWMMLGLCIVAGVVALGLRETAPRVLARRAG